MDCRLWSSTVSGAQHRIEVCRTPTYWSARLSSSVVKIGLVELRVVEALSIAVQKWRSEIQNASSQDARQCQKLQIISDWVGIRLLQIGAALRLTHHFVKPNGVDDCAGAVSSSGADDRS